MKKKITLILLMLGLSVSAYVNAQPFTLYASGFSNLIGLSFDSNGNLWVAEAGSGLNDSKISMITPAAISYEVVTGLPSFFDTMSGETSGAWRAEMISSDVLMVVAGGGPDTNAGSLLFYNVSGFVPGVSLPFTVSDADSILHISYWAYGNGFTDSNPFSAALDANGNILIADAGANALIKYETSTQTYSVLDTFPAFANPFPGPPPSFDYVPTRIISNPSGGYYLGNLGAFFPGNGRVVAIDDAGMVSVLDSGFTSVVDIQLNPFTGDIYMLQFGEFDTSFAPIPGSAKIFRIDMSGNSTELYTGFGPSSSFVLDGIGGAYVSEIFTGNILYFSDINGIPSIKQNKTLSLSVSPNPFSTSVKIDIESVGTSDSKIEIKNVLGKTVFTSDLILQNGLNNFTWDGRSLLGEDMPAGNYLLTIHTKAKSSSVKILKQ